MYEYFGILLGCSQFGTSYVPYGGDPSMYDVHKFMALDKYEVGWFIQQVGLAATSLGVSAADATAVGAALVKYFDYRCLEPAQVIPGSGPLLQSICTDVS